ncbi:hypothetical protein [Nostoc sp. NMS4]|uniref:hypothetical protein n=1 Tax=Nostoc sp. NMS4 TaxID=2815390 RepID=UPI0025DD6FAA|nr:hypothetical protein [Nostoc sp. NMS4]MBN3923366.1 hypothetical protein [Nostoc sp. NMS4]
MTYQKIPKSAAGNAKTSETTSQLTSRPFAPTTKQTTPAPIPEQQQDQTEGLQIQRKTNLLEIPGLMAAPKTKLSKVIQAKLTIGEPGDKYEQEADTVARQVVQRLHATMPNQIPDISQPKSEFAQKMKAKRWQQSRGYEQTGISANIQRQTMPEEELQMKPMLQKRMAAAPNLEASIEQAHRGGQPLADNFRKPIVQRTSDIVIQRGLKTLESVPSRDLYAEDQAERERHKRDAGKLKEKIKETEHKTNTEMSIVKPGLILDKSKIYIWVVKTIDGKDEIIIGDEKDPITGDPTQGHPTLARDPDAPEGEEGSKTVAAKTAGELSWDKDLNAWILNNKSGRFGVSLRPEIKDGVAEKPSFDKSVMKGVAKLFRERIGDPEFNIRYKPWRIMRADGTVDKDKTGESYELKPPKKIPKTNNPEETEITETNDPEETEILETNNPQETEIPETNNHQETEIPETNNHQETEITETNNLQETEIPETNDHISKKGKIRIPILRGKEIRSSKKFPFLKIRKK